MDCEENYGALNSSVDTEIINQTELTELPDGEKIVTKNDINLNSCNRDQEFPEKNQCIETSNGVNEKEHSSNEDTNQILNGEVTQPGTGLELTISNILDKNPPEQTVLEQLLVSDDLINSTRTSSNTTACSNLDKCDVDQNSNSEFLDQNNSAPNILSKLANVITKFCPDKETGKKHSNNLSISDSIIIQECTVNKIKDTNDSSTGDLKAEQDLNKCVDESRILESDKSQSLKFNEGITEPPSRIHHSIDEKCVNENVCSKEDEHNNLCDNLKEEDVSVNKCTEITVNCNNSKEKKISTDIQNKKVDIVQSSLEEVSISSDVGNVCTESNISCDNSVEKNSDDIQAKKIGADEVNIGGDVVKKCTENNVSCDNSAEEKNSAVIKTEKVDIVESSLSIGSDDIDIDGFEFEENETDDEIDSILPEFVDSEYSKKNNDEEKSDVNIILSDSEAEMDSVIEAFKADDSEDDCLIIEDDSKEILLTDDKTVDNEPPIAKIIKIVDSYTDCNAIRSSYETQSSNTTAEKTIKIKTNDTIIRHKIKETPTGIYLQTNADAIIVDKLTQNSLSTNSQNTKAVATINEDKPRQNSLPTNSQSSKADATINEDKLSPDSLPSNSHDNVAISEVSNNAGDENSDSVLDLINENIDSIVLLINESSPEKMSEKSVVKTNVSDHKDSCKIESNSDIKNLEESNQIHDNLIQNEVKEFLSSLIDQLDSSEYSNVADCESDSEDMEILESIKRELLKDSSDSESILNSPLPVSVSSPKSKEKNVDMKDVKIILEKFSSQLKEDTITYNEIANKVVLPSSDKLIKDEDVKTDSKFVAEKISLDSSLVPPQPTMSGLFSLCNDDDKMKENHGSQEPVIEAYNCEEEMKPIKLGESSSQIEPELLINGNSNNSEKKRKLEDAECNNESEKKKIKEEKFEMPDSFTEGSLGYNKVQEMVSDFLQNKSVDKFETNSNWLMKIAHVMCCKTVHDMYLDDMEDMCDLVQTLEKSIKNVSEKMDNFRNIAETLCAKQTKAFEDLNFNPKVQTRTVGVNVKIFRECDLRSSGFHTPSTSSSAPLPSPSSLKVIPSEKAKSLLSTLPKTTNESPLKTSSILKPQQTLIQTPTKTLQTQQSTVVTPVARTMSNINTPRAIASSQRFISPPNVTVAKSGMFTSANPSNVLSHNTPGQSQKQSNQLIDLTDDESIAANKAIAAGSTNAVSPTAATVSKVNLPSTIQRNNVLVPFGNVLHMVPSTQNRPLNQSQMTRQIVPSIPSNLIGQRTLGYLVTANTNNPVNTNTFGGRGGISVPTFISNQNQRMQTFVVRMTNPSGTAPLSTLVNNTSRMPAIPQTSNATGTLSSPSGLVLFPHTPRHPAPFPQMPTYPYNPKLKSVPPKPSLKGSRADSGIILSWNIHVFNPNHADITSYQLFAYQETAGPVSAALWKNVGNINALPLPMACALTQFIEGHRYYFTVRAVDCHGRFGPFSPPVSILYSRNT